MNKNERNKTILANDDKVAIVKEQLEKILIGLQEGKIPEEKNIKDLKHSFGEYRAECTRLRKTAQIGIQESEPVLEMRKVSFTDVLPDGQEESIEGAFLLNGRNIHVLKQFAMKKFIQEEDIEDIGDAKDYLIHNGIVASVSANICGNKIIGYCLTTKGWKIIQDKNIADFIRKQDESFLLTENLYLHPENWRDITFIRMIMIQLYYKSEGIDDYFVFVIDDKLKMPMGCKIQDSYSVNYCFAGVFDEDAEIEMQEASVLYDLAGSDKIDDLTIIVQSKEDEKRLKMQRGLETRTLKKLHYFDLTEVNRK